MKTAEEWQNESPLSKMLDNKLVFNWIKEIQLDAYKAGMTKAAEIVDKTGRVDEIFIARNNTTKL